MNLGQIRAVYDRRARTYDRTVGCGERVLLGGLRRAFGAELRGATLEVAVGSGLNLPHYGPDVDRAVGVDLSRGMLWEARQRVATLARPVALVQMDAQRLAFPAASFDTVAISLALCTVPDPAAALRELARVCKPGGRVVLLEHVRSPYWPVALFQHAVSPLQERFIGCHLTRETEKNLRYLGFTIISEHTRLFGIFRLLVAAPPPHD
ncbi:MAG: methyltransferase domain-containing protein [Chloroflexia bacterium]|nr:methyltransferase domain-containing protein [Chloroflexia bacterium]